MFPFTFAPTYEFPLSGDVVQDIDTSWFARMKGIPELEREIVTEVWSYGDQLGSLTDVLLEVVDQIGLESDAVTKLREKAAEMETAKARAVVKVRERVARAERDLERVEAVS